MATTAARAHQYDPLRRMEGVNLRSALRRSPRASSLAAAALLVPLGAALLGLSGLVLLITLGGLAVATPLFVLFSPVLVPAVFAAGLAVAGFLTAGALGVAGLSSLLWVAGYARRESAWGGRGGVAGLVVQPLDNGGKKHGADEAAFVGHRFRGAGDAVHDKAQEVART